MNEISITVSALSTVASHTQVNEEGICSTLAWTRTERPNLKKSKGFNTVKEHTNLKLTRHSSFEKKINVKTQKSV